MAATLPPPLQPAILIQDLVVEFLLRLPPEDPEVLVRAALVSKQWYRIITGPVFHRRFREYHRSPPLLGYITNIADIASRDNNIHFIPMSSFRPRHANLSDARAVHSSHGHVLLQRSFGQYREVLLSVWDPVTNEVRDLPPLPVTVSSLTCNWDAAIISLGDGSNHFKVVFLGTPMLSVDLRNFSCFYSSEASDSWSDPIFASVVHTSYFITGTGVHVGTALYFMGGCNKPCNNEIFKYDLVTNQLSTIFLTIGPGGGGIGTMLIGTEDDRLGVSRASYSTLHLWIREHGRWEEETAIELSTILPPEAQWRCREGSSEAFTDRPCVVGIAEKGAGVIFLRTCVGYFTVDLNSGRSKNVGKCLGWGGIIPYVTFCTPVPGAVSTNDGQGAGGVVLIDEGPGAVACQANNKKLKLHVEGFQNQEV